jgi:trigger factor
MPQITPPKKAKQSRLQSTVTFTADETQKAEEAVLRKLSQSIKVEGFRPGKAPADMLKAKIDPGTLLEETIRELLPPVFDAIIREHKAQPIIPPSVDLQTREPLTMIVTVVEKPEIKVKGSEKIRIKKKDAAIDPKQIDRMLDYLRDQYRQTKPVDRPSKKGDEMVVDFVGNREGTEVPGTRAKDYRALLGSNSLIPGFEEAMEGLKKGDTKTFTVTFPDKYHAEELQGKPVEFTVTVNGVEEVVRPELTDAFVTEHKLGESAKALRDRVEKSIRDQEDQADRMRREKELFDAIREATSIELAPELVLHERRAIEREIGENLEREKTTLEDWLKQTDRTMDKLVKELEEEATKRLTLRFAIQHLLDERKIEVADADLEKEIEHMLEHVPANERARYEAMYKPGAEGRDELSWRKRVEKLVETMLAQ